MKRSAGAPASFTLLSVALSALLLTACAPQTFFTQNSIIGPRLAAPPPGKALVNFHMPSSWGAGFDVPIFRETGELIGDVTGGTEFQYLCDPGQPVFIGFADRPLKFKGIFNGDTVGSVAVVKATVDANKTYDILTDVSMGWNMPAIYLTPLAGTNWRRPQLPEFEAREKSVSSGLRKTPDVEEYTKKQQPRIEEIKKDFLGGPKQDRLRYLNKEDCR